MPLRQPHLSSTPQILLLALFLSALIVWPLLGQDRLGAELPSGGASATVHFRTAPFDFGHERAAPAEFVLALRPPLA